MEMRDRIAGGFYGLLIGDARAMAFHAERAGESRRIVKAAFA